MVPPFPLSPTLLFSTRTSLQPQSPCMVKGGGPSPMAQASTSQGCRIRLGGSIRRHQLQPWRPCPGATPGSSHGLYNPTTASEDGCSATISQPLSAPATLPLCHVLPASCPGACYSLCLEHHSRRVSQGSAQCHTPPTTFLTTLCHVAPPFTTPARHPLLVSTEDPSLSEVIWVMICGTVSFLPPLLEQKLHEGKGFPCPIHRQTSPVPRTGSGKISNAFRGHASGNNE